MMNVTMTSCRLKGSHFYIHACNGEEILATILNMYSSLEVNLFEFVEFWPNSWNNRGMALNLALIFSKLYYLWIFAWIHLWVPLYKWQKQVKRMDCLFWICGIVFVAPLNAVKPCVELNFPTLWWIFPFEDSLSWLYHIHFGTNLIKNAKCWHK